MQWIDLASHVGGSYTHEVDHVRVATGATVSLFTCRVDEMNAGVPGAPVASRVPVLGFNQSFHLAVDQFANGLVLQRRFSFDGATWFFLSGYTQLNFVITPLLGFQWFSWEQLPAFTFLEYRLTNAVGALSFVDGAITLRADKMY